MQPTLGVAIALADALGISLSRLAGYPAHDLDFSGRWWAGWETSHGGQGVVHYHEVAVDQDERTLRLDALTRAAPLHAGGYLWRGELELWDNEVMLGWYSATEGAVRSKGTLYFVTHAQGLVMVGRWVGLSHDGPIVTGWAAMARTKPDAERHIEHLLNEGAQSPWSPPRTSAK